MIKDFLRKALLSTVYLSAIVWLDGCAISNEGAIDYRKAELIKPASDAQKAVSTGPGSSLNDRPLYPAILERKDFEAKAGDAVIETMDKVSIHLRGGFLSGCNDKPISNPVRMLGRSEWWQINSIVWKNCEIAILFRAFEMSEGSDFNFKPGSHRDARLVYFSHDVQVNQFFNLHNLPVYGPLDYSGKPIGIEIFIIEVDIENREMFSLLKSLAAIGAKAYAPADPVLGVMDKIGSTLMSSGTDDIEYRYTMVLDPSGGYKGVAYSTAEAGDYVFIRREDRTSEPEWSQLVLDHNTGRVWKKKDENNDYELYRDDTYMTVQIRRNAGTADVALAQNTYGAFRDALEGREQTEDQEQTQTNQTQTNQTQTRLTRLIEDLKQLVVHRERIKNFNRAQKLYEDMVFLAKRSENEYLAKQAAFELYKLLQDSIKKLNNKKKDGPSKLSRRQVKYLLEKLRRRARVDTADEMEKYSIDKFNCPKIGDFNCLKIDDFIEKMVPNDNDSSAP